MDGIGRSQPNTHINQTQATQNKGLAKAGKGIIF